MNTVVIDSNTATKLVEVAKHLGTKDATKCLAACVEAMIAKINMDATIKANEDFAVIADDCFLHPSSFDGANAVFTPPQGKTEDEVYSLIGAHIKWGNDPAVLTCWKPTEQQIERLKTTGRLWLTLLVPYMVPVCLTVEKPTVFGNVKFIKA